MKCARCKQEIARGSHPWCEITGWEQRRVGGGTNYVALRKQTGRLMCDPCMHLLRSGHEGQTSLEGAA